MFTKRLKSSRHPSLQTVIHACHQTAPHATGCTCPLGLNKGYNPIQATKVDSVEIGGEAKQRWTIMTTSNSFETASQVEAAFGQI
jgi:hypothetical protein